MINLSVCDKIDGLGKIDELRNAVGTDYCGDNQLVSVSKDGDRCTVKRTVIGGHTKLVNEPSWLTWNRMFY
jgi:hypothetical protein|tara:strand:+ start:102 stop:314 length:213 start_codon:yes stop_codon:yes gene_type:complete